MVKRKVLFIFLLILFMTFIGGILVVIIKNKSPEIKTFEVSEYQYYIDNFSSEENVGSIIDAKDAIKKSEIIWIKLYGENIKKEKPFKVFYDAKSEIWLVQGTLRSNMMGGVANILIDNDTGKVLAVWHDK